MNSDRRFLRSRIRHEVIPQLRAVNRHLVRTLAHAAETLAADASVLADLTAGVLSACVADGGDLDLVKLSAQPAELRGRLLRRWLTERRGTARGIAFAHVRSVLELTERPDPSGEVRLPRSGIVVREYQRLRYEPEVTGTGANVHVAWRADVCPGSRFEIAGGWLVSAEMVRSPGAVPTAERTLWHFWADAEAVGERLELRSVRNGDRIQPLGGRGRRKLQDVFVDRKVPRSRRWGLPALEAEGRLLWIPGVVRSRHALVSTSTKSAWRIVIAASGVAGS